VARGRNLEIEVKLAFGSVARARAALLQAGFARQSRRALEQNALYDTPDGSLRAARRAVRYRLWSGRHIITYKGPANVNARGHKSREELETTVADPSAILASWQAAGLVPSFRYEKYRTLYARPGEHGHAMIDETPLGIFVELEGTSAWIDRMAKALGFSPDEYITLSYAALQAEACRKRRSAFRDLLFGKPKKFP
jgi:adenylate cyclase, class 2